MLNSKDECTHNREHRVHSISHRADEIDTPHLRTCTSSHNYSFPVLLPVELTHVLAKVLALLGPLLQWLAVLIHVLAPLGPLLQWLVSWFQLIALVLALPAHLLLLPVVLTRVLTPPGLCVQWLVSRC